MLSKSPFNCRCRFADCGFSRLTTRLGKEISQVVTVLIISSRLLPSKWKGFSFCQQFIQDDSQTEDVRSGRHIPSENLFNPTLTLPEAPKTPYRLRFPQINPHPPAK